MLEQRRDPITIVAYDGAWPALFEREQVRVEAALGPWLVGPVEHIGSTSVPGLPAKPIIDMLAGSPTTTMARPSPRRWWASVGWLPSSRTTSRTARGRSASRTSAGGPTTSMSWSGARWMARLAGLPRPPPNPSRRCGAVRPDQVSAGRRRSRPARLPAGESPLHRGGPSPSPALNPPRGHGSVHRQWRRAWRFFTVSGMKHSTVDSIGLDGRTLSSSSGPPAAVKGREDQREDSRKIGQPISVRHESGSGLSRGPTR